ncbi:MAG: penicillin-binding protein 1A [Bacteroidia bacterium]
MEEYSTLTAEQTETDSQQKTAKVRKKRSFKGPRRLVMISVIGIAALIAVFLVIATQNLPSLAEIENPTSSLSTQLLSADGVVLDNFYSRENRVKVKLNDVSRHAIDALIATEDARFYQHSGVDYMLAPAIIKRFINGTTSGGSTITMQLSRNLFNQVGNERTGIRKIKELVVSAILERKFTKEEIMMAYLNTVNIFGNAYGIEMAAQRLFAKPSRDLTIEESATLIGMLKGQGVYDPIRRAERVVGRRNTVIDQMVKYEFIDPTTINVDSVKAMPLVVAPQVQGHLKGMAPHFRQKVREYLVKWCDTHTKPDGSHYDMYNDGLKVYTTIDSRMQRHAEAAVRKHLTNLQATFDDHIKGREAYNTEPNLLRDLRRRSERYRQAKGRGATPEQITEEFDKKIKMTIFDWDGVRDTIMSPNDSLKYYSSFLETGVVSINPLNGEVKAWVGGLDFRFFKYDHVQQGKRQAGSIFKPFVYAVAVRDGYSPCDKLLNQPVTFENVDNNGTTWKPKNSDGKFGGMMTLRQGLAKSVNLITARLMKNIGPYPVVDLAKRMGIKSPLEAVPSICLGTSDVNVLELTGAYTTFANQGIWNEPHYITRIEDRNGEILAEFPVETKRIFNDKDAYKMVELLKGVVDEPGGTASRLRHQYKFRNEIAAKTGTTQNHSDGWFMGVTPNLVTGVWVGAADRRVRFNSIKLGQGANMALPIWAYYMQELYDDEAIGLPQDRFKRSYYGGIVCDDPVNARLPENLDGNSRDRAEEALDGF